jgi:hypothetical protein
MYVKGDISRVPCSLLTEIYICKYFSVKIYVIVNLRISKLLKELSRDVDWAFDDINTT